jgi:hypothetical protein
MQQREGAVIQLHAHAAEGRQGGLDLPLDGGSDTLRASTTWDVDPDGRLSLKHGDSFIQWTEWLPGKRVVSRSIQPFGSASTRPKSPHYNDQMRLFVECVQIVAPVLASRQWMLPLYSA